MNEPSPSVQADLAFLRALAGDGGTSFLRNFGEVYLATGLCYTIQILGHGAQFAFGDRRPAGNEKERHVA